MNIFNEFFNKWSLSVESLDDKDRHSQNYEMFDYLINNIQFFKSKIEDKYDNEIISLSNYDKEKERKLIDILDKRKSDKNIKKLENMEKYTLHIKQEYEKLVTLKNRRTKENINLRINQK